MSDLIHTGTAYDICDGGRGEGGGGDGGSGEGGGEGGGSNTSHAKGQNPVQYQFTFTPYIALRWPCTCAVGLAVAQHASNATTATCASSIVGTGAHHSDDTPDEAT